MDISIGKRFWPCVNVGGLQDCWEWNGSPSGRYGQFMIDRKNIGSHRVSWELTYGPIPIGKSILHRCDNSRCVNPFHLYVGTQADNISDRAMRNSHNQGGMPSRLSDESILKIRSMYKEKKHTQEEVAQIFGVSRPNISLIVNHKNNR